MFKTFNIQAVCGVKLYFSLNFNLELKSTIMYGNKYEISIFSTVSTLHTSDEASSVDKVDAPSHFIL